MNSEQVCFCEAQHLYGNSLDNDHVRLVSAIPKWRIILKDAEKSQMGYVTVGLKKFDPGWRDLPPDVPCILEFTAVIHHVKRIADKPMEAVEKALEAFKLPIGNLTSQKDLELISYGKHPTFELVHQGTGHNTGMSTIWENVVQCRTTGVYLKIGSSSDEMDTRHSFYGQVWPIMVRDWTSTPPTEEKEG